VRVPVLSNTIKLTLPLTLIRGGEIQKMRLLLSLAMAKAAPAVIAAGRAGGTVIVMRSNERSTISSGLRFCLNIKGRVPKNPTIAIRPIKKINLSES
jgi:hypothetical protein